MAADDRGFYALAKFGREEHLEDLRQRGHLYMNTLAYFWELENDVARSDWLEGADRLVPPDEIDEIVLNAADSEYRIRQRDLAGAIKVSLAWTAAINVYCMFAFTVPVTTPLVDPRNFAFGDSFVFFTDTTALLNRVRDALAGTGMRHRFWLVDYVDLEHEEARPGGFAKHRRFSYQNEFRIAIYGDDATPADLYEPYSLFVGNLEDISTDVQPLERINELVTVK